MNMCSTSKAHLQYKRGCAVRVKHIIISMNEYVQYKQGTSSVQERMRSTGKVDHQVLVRRSRGGGGTTQKYFLMNESLLLLIYQVKMVSSVWQAAKIN